jgi:hypothetical protein
VMVIVRERNDKGKNSNHKNNDPDQHDSLHG